MKLPFLFATSLSLSLVSSKNDFSIISRRKTEARLLHWRNDRKAATATTVLRLPRGGTSSLADDSSTFAEPANENSSDAQSTPPTPTKETEPAAQPLLPPSVAEEIAEEECDGGMAPDAVTAAATVSTDESASSGMCGEPSTAAAGTLAEEAPAKACSPEASSVAMTRASPPPPEPAAGSPKQMTKATMRAVKYGSFILLVVQNSALTCTMRWSRAHAKGPLYHTSTAVVMSELIKIVVSSLLLLKESGSWGAFTETVRTEIVGKPEECLKLLVPGLLYTIQNNLQYVAAANLQPAVFQVMYQVKMLTTACLSVCMLKKNLKPSQWGGVGLLMGGLVLVQMSQMGSGGGGNGGVAAGGSAAVGFSAVLSACTLAGFAGCYLERVLKGSSTSLWVRNLQLGAWGSLLGVASVALKDGRSVVQQGFFYGYSPVVWTVVGIQACGGLLISLVVRYGDALLKGFATGLAIILTTAVSVAFFDFKVTPTYLAGASTTLTAVLLYSGILPKLIARALGRMPFAALGGADDGTLQASQTGSSNPQSSVHGLPLATGYPWSRVAVGGALHTLLALPMSLRPKPPRQSSRTTEHNSGN
eukprot:CAMPEP_0171912806 /NCGR_PEP_ID=MMETSP0993-20121228/11370_1 /TAXON_ID=483369 /ORGANISM="non described non described, Strain CCMP2098" /LENGTH=588 /DNA_ID=CAMNT_0012546717 /DNA_START=43 /DNA_END=1809 /DNA_ORIENTATION=+